MAIPRNLLICIGNRISENAITSPSTRCLGPIRLLQLSKIFASYTFIVCKVQCTFGE